MGKYTSRFYKPDEINFTDHWALDTQWSVDGSKDNVYTIKMTKNGFSCECFGMSMHGKCKHTRAIGEGFIGDTDV